jgi:hypothetical protein
MKREQLPQSQCWINQYVAEIKYQKFPMHQFAGKIFSDVAFLSHLFSLLL